MLSKTLKPKQSMADTAPQRRWPAGPGKILRRRVRVPVVLRRLHRAPLP